LPSPFALPSPIKPEKPTLARVWANNDVVGVSLAVEATPVRNGWCLFRGPDDYKQTFGAE
jgi:hypothetical protein